MLPMKYRKLRIVFSSMCGVLCLLLIVLWVRSYRWYDFTPTGVTSARGILYVGHEISITPSQGSVGDVKTSDHRDHLFDVDSIRGTVVDVQPVGRGISLPYSTLILPILALTAVPWLPWSTRFNLRTLLIATTVVAMVLGLIVWASR